MCLVTFFSFIKDFGKEAESVAFVGIFSPLCSLFFYYYCFNEPSFLFKKGVKKNKTRNFAINKLTIQFILV